MRAAAETAAWWRVGKQRCRRRFARLLRESRWLFVVAALAFLTPSFLANAHRSGWSFSGSSESLGNRGGFVGAWLADLLLTCSVHRRGGGGGWRRADRQRVSPHRRSGSQERSPAHARIDRFCDGAARFVGDRGDAPVALAVALPGAPEARSVTSSVRRSRPAIGFNAPTLRCWRVAVGFSCSPASRGSS